MTTKVTRADIEKRIDTVDYIGAASGNASTSTIAIIKLDNGFEVIGHSATVDAANFDAELGERLAYEDAIKQLFGIFAFLKLESAHTRKNGSFNAALLAMKEGKQVTRAAFPRQLNVRLSLRGDKLYGATTYGAGPKGVVIAEVESMLVENIVANDWEVAG